MTTGREMCELVAQYCFDTTGHAVDAQTLWNSLPGGELAPLFGLYWQARAYYGMHTAEQLPASPALGDVAIVPTGERESTVACWMGQQWVTTQTVRQHESVRTSEQSPNRATP